jgi:hypothetical protein
MPIAAIAAQRLGVEHEVAALGKAQIALTQRHAVASGGRGQDAPLNSATHSFVRVGAAAAHLSRIGHVAC